ncbi:hypothetical protein D3C77_37740 [compost metagenome]
MSRQTSVVEISNFVAGLITEASPLTFPNNASLDEQNFVLRRDGSRRRRLGIDYEEGHSIISTNIAPGPGQEVAFETYQWPNAGGDAAKTLVVVQVGNEIRVFDTSNGSVSSHLIFTYTVTGSDTFTRYSFATVDGELIIASGTPNILLFKYDNGQITASTGRLLIRDLFGVEDIISGENLRVGNGVTTRPSTLAPQHLYNLRNQTWAEPRKVLSNEDVQDLITNFNFRAPGKYPSNADVTTFSIYPDSNDGDDRLTDRFNAFDVINNPIGTTSAPKGYFIIDALSRGSSRLQEEVKLRGRYPQLQHQVSSLPPDLTPGGPTVVAEYAGRIFYAGFSGEVSGGDANSPKMSSYILFSQLVEDPTDIFSCYQVGDPTSKEEPDLLDTDGGFIRIEGAYGITRMIAVNNALVVVATNGVWLIQGGSDYGFKATNYLTTKVTSYGCNSPSSVVQVDTSVIYWGEDGIYVIAQNQYGDYIAENLTQKTIQSFYEDIPSLDRVYCAGTYDNYERKVYWTYGNRLQSSGSSKQLVFDTTLGAFYPFVFEGDSLPKITAGVKVPPYRLEIVPEAVTVLEEEVTAGGNLVTVSSEIMQSALNETIYLTIVSIAPTIRFTFSSYNNTEFKDWVTSDGIGVDAKAYLLTGWMSGGDHQRYKQVPYITFHFIKTENGFEAEDSGDWSLRNQSSCLVSAQWEWSNHINSGRWGKQFQAYRLRRHYFPADLSDGFDNGFYTVITKNKLRGKGRVVSLLIETEPEKDCFLLGWSMVMGSNNNV